jgi:hypothetical protein
MLPLHALTASAVRQPAAADFSTPAILAGRASADGASAVEMSSLKSRRVGRLACEGSTSQTHYDILAGMVLTQPHVAAYFERLAQRPSYKRVIAEAQPYFHLFPYQETIPVRFREVGQSAL